MEAPPFPNFDVALLHFCTRCGERVSPYPPSRVSLSDLYEYGTEPAGLDAEPHYWCQACRRTWLATNLMDTGAGCPACHAFMPMAVRFCGACGAEMAPPKTRPRE